MSMTKRSWKIIAIVAGILAAVIIALAVVLPIFIDPNRYHSRIVSEIQKAVGGDVRLGHMTWGISNGVWVEADSLEIADADAFPGSASFSRVFVKVSLPPLMSGNIVFTEVALEGPRAALNLAPLSKKSIPKTESLQPDPAASPVPTDASPEITLRAFAISLDRVELIDSLTLPGRKVERTFKDVVLTAEDIIPGRQAAFRIMGQDSASQGLGRFSASGTFKVPVDPFTVEYTELMFSADVASLHMDALKLYLGKSAAAKGLAGDISFTINYRETDPSGHRLDGRIDVSGFSYMDAKRWVAPISGADTAITFDVALDSKTFTVEKLAIQRCTSAVRAAGVFHQWLIRPILKDLRISADVISLSELVPLIPWKQVGPNAGMFQTAMEQGGKLTIKQAVFSDIDFSAPPKTAADWLSKLEIAAVAEGVSVQPSPDVPMFEDIHSGLSLKSGNLTFTDTRAQLGPEIRLTGQGRIRDIGGKRPILETAEFKTGFPVSALLPLMPWKQFGKQATTIRHVLEGGGSVAIEHAVVRDIDLNSPPETAAALLPRIEVKASVSGMSMRPSKTLPDIENVAGQIDLRESKLTVSDARGRIGPVSLPRLEIDVTEIVKRPKITVTAKGLMKIAATRQKSVKKLLNAYGLKRLDGAAKLDLTTTVDLKRPDKWTASGTMVLEGVQAESHPAGVVMENLRGQVTIRRKQLTTVSVKDVSAKIDRAPIRLSGKFSRLGSPEAVIDARAYTKNLDLANLRQLTPALRESGLAGSVTMDLDVYIPYGEPTKSRLKGMLAARQVSLDANDYSIRNTDANIDLSGNTAIVKRLTGTLNDQPLSANGRLTNPAAPNIELVISSPNLNLDRLVPVARADAEPAESSWKAGKPSSKKPGLPPMAQKASANLTLTAKKGQYRGLAFQNLTLKAIYTQGVLKTYDLQFGSGQGRVALLGSADLRKADRIPFSITPHISAIPIEQLAGVVGLPESSVTGPIFLKGQLSGRTGSRKAFLGSLEGNLEAQMGPGRFRKIGQAGELMAKILSLTSVQGLLSGALFRDFDKDGLNYKTITTQAAFSKGNLDIKNLQLDSDSMNMAAQGRIDMVNEQLNLAMNLGTLGPLPGEVLKAIPLFGKPVDGLTEIQVAVNGSFEKPDIRMGLIQGAEKAPKAEERNDAKPIRSLGDLLKQLGQ